MAERNLADVGLVGLAVMGQNLALNMADHGFKVAVFNRTTQVMKDFIAANPNTPGGLIRCEKLTDLVAAVKKPRKVVLLVKAGPAVDTVTKQLIEAGVESDDLIVDCANSQWTDTIRREKEYSSHCRFLLNRRLGNRVFFCRLFFYLLPDAHRRSIPVRPPPPTAPRKPTREAARATEPPALKGEIRGAPENQQARIDLMPMG